MDVPSGYSPNLQNVRFLPRAVLTRPGLTPRVIGGPFLGAAQFINNSGIRTTILMDANGFIFTNPSGSNTTTLLNVQPISRPGSLMKVQQSFGREFMSTFLGPPSVTEPISPGGPIRHWDGNLDLAPGPPAAPTAADSAVAGTVSAGVHKVAVIFEMTYGLLSGIGATASWTAAGGKKAHITNIPLGPVGCMARRLVLTTVADTTAFWFLPSFKINDNVTTTIDIDGSDTVLPQQGYPLAYTNGGLNQGSFLPNLPPLSPDGPGAAPFLANDSTSYGAVNIVASPNGATETSLTVTITTTTPHGFLVGQTVNVAGVGVGGYNNTTVVITAVPSSTTFQYLAGTSGLANSGNGTATLTGSIAIGIRQVQVLWETRWGFLTAPSPNTSIQCPGGQGLFVNNLPIGPWYVIARRILVTLSGGSDFFYITQNRVGDNTTTSARIDFSDTILAAGSNFNYVARNFSPMDSYGVGVYGGRLVTWGGLNTLKALNLAFDGGWNFADGSPMGWIADTNFAGGARESLFVFCGESWKITGDGATSIRGQIKNQSIQPLLQPNTQYTVSFRAALNGAGSASQFLNVELFSPSVGLLSSTVQIATSSITGNYTEFQGTILNGVAAIPSDTVLRVYSSGTLSSGVYVYIDHIRVWPTNTKYEASIVRLSNPLDPETFDGVNGFVQIAKDNGEQVVGCVQLRSFYYIFKERSMHTTYDDGSNPPSLWFTRAVDNTIGAGSPNSVISSDTFLISMFRSGAYLYSGGRPMKVSQEIQTTWNKFNWQTAWANHVLLDTQGKQLFFFGPLNTDTVPRNSLVLDYSEGIGTEDDPAGRKWDIDQWPNSINASFKFETTASDHPTSVNRQALYFAGPKLYEHVGTDDDGTPIDSFYETAFVKAGDHGQDVFLGCSYLAEGTGQILVSLRGLDDVTIDTLIKVINLTSNPGIQYEMWGNLETERAKLRFEMVADNTNFTIKGATIYAQPNMFDQRPA